MSDILNEKQAALMQVMLGITNMLYGPKEALKQNMDPGALVRKFQDEVTAYDLDAKDLSLIATYAVMEALSAQAAAVAATHKANEAFKLAVDAKEEAYQARKLALTDQLTGISNRRAYDEAIAKEQSRTDKTGKPYTLLVLDIDHFKKFNDTYGHETGDHVLRIVAEKLSHGVRKKDMAARYGGEEMCVILPDTTLEQGRKVAEKIRSMIEATPLAQRNGDEKIPGVTVSIGIAQSRPGESMDDIFKRADAGLYAAKQAGRNCVRVHEEKPDVQASISKPAQGM